MLDVAGMSNAKRMVALTVHKPGLAGMWAAVCVH